MHEDIDGPHNYEHFYTTYGKLLEELHAEYPEHTILVNMSSGTPQMSMAAAVICASSELPVKAMQVTTPTAGSNNHIHFGDGCDFEECYANLLDNLKDDADIKNRCSEVHFENLIESYAKQRIIELMHNYDYTAASALAQSGYINGDAAEYIEGLACRSSLDMAGAKRHGLSLAAGGLNVSRILEYYLISNLRAKQGNRTEYILRLSPLLTESIKYYLEKKYKLKETDYCEKNGANILCIKRYRLQRLDPALFEYIELTYFKSELKDGFLNFYSVYAITEGCSHLNGDSDARLCGMLHDLRIIEEKLRNAAAHSIIQMDEKTVVSLLSGEDLNSKVSSFGDIVRLTGSVMRAVFGSVISEALLSSYDEANLKAEDLMK